MLKTKKHPLYLHGDNLKNSFIMPNLSKEMSLHTFGCLELVWIFKSQSISYDLIRPMPSVFFLLGEAFLVYSRRTYFKCISSHTNLYVGWQAFSKINTSDFIISQKCFFSYSIINNDCFSKCFL